MNAFELERLTHGRLRRLPAPAAPPTLLPRVLAAANAWVQRPWYAREWFSWPLAWQLGSLMLVVATIGLSVALTPMLQLLTARAAASLTPVVAIDVTPVVGGVEMSFNLLRVIWHGLVEPFLPYALAIVLVMCGACFTVVVALNRLVFGRALHS